MKNIEAARAKAAAGERLTLEDALALYEDNDLLFLADCARRAKEKKSGRSVYYTVNRHINLTNICSSNCPLCAFQVEAGDARGFVMEPGDIERVLEQAKKTPNLSEIHIVSALHPDKPFSYYRAVVRQVKAALPHVDVKAFTPVEIVNFAKMTGKSIREVLSLLKEDGLDSLPGGGAEILVDEVRRKFLQEEYSRMPVYERTLDNIIGIITEKEFFKQYEKNSDFTVRSIMQETLYLPQMQKLSEVFRTMQKQKCHMSVVLDQHGGTLGIVTMEDILEELVGEIWDESDEVKSPVTVVGNNVFEVYGDVSLNSLRRFLEARDIPADIESEAHTVAGWVLGLFGSIPKNGDTVTSGMFTVTVLEAAELRVIRVRIEIKKNESEEQ